MKYRCPKIEWLSTHVNFGKFEWSLRVEKLEKLEKARKAQKKLEQLEKLEKARKAQGVRKNFYSISENVNFLDTK